MPTHPNDCLGCAINRIIRRLAKDHGGSQTHLQDVAALRKFGRAVAHEVRKEVERRHADA
jgi:hypothetical protein